MIRQFTRGTLIILLLLTVSISFAQARLDFRKVEDSLIILSSKIRKAENDSVKFSCNELLREILYRTLSQPGSFDYPFDSLKTIARLTSPDKSFRIYNWNLPKADGTNTYFGFIQLSEKGKINYKIFSLTDCSDSIADPENSVLDYHTWYGALYYKIILTTCNKRKFFTLLGWDGVNPQITQKVIEVLYFDESGTPSFGAKIFRNFGNDQICRVLFKYSSSASMVLTYDNQYLVRSKKWDSAKKQFESVREKADMIVCDELVPLETQFEGRFEYYFPSSEVFNGFVFNDGYWHFYKNVDVRNKRN